MSQSRSDQGLRSERDLRSLSLPFRPGTDPPVYSASTSLLIWKVAVLVPTAVSVAIAARYRTFRKLLVYKGNVKVCLPAFSYVSSDELKGLTLSTITVLQCERGFQPTKDMTECARKLHPKSGSTKSFWEKNLAE